MFFHVNLLIFGFIVLAESVDRQKFAAIPSPDSSFSLDKWMGLWYIHRRYVPASYIGSVEFTDFNFTNYQDSGNFKVRSQHVWRDRMTGVCAGADFFAFLTETPGAFKLKDTIGNTYSGDWIVVLLDSNLGLDISWGCTKIAIDGRCADPWVSVKTRERDLSNGLRDYANEKLMEMFGMTIEELEYVPHSNPCFDDNGNGNSIELQNVSNGDRPPQPINNGNSF